MKFELLKKVNEPISFKGFRGIYLNYALITLGIGFLTIIIIFISISDRMILFSLLGAVLILVLLLLNNFKDKSKGDYNIHHKKRANRNVFIKGLPINYKKIKHGNKRS